MSKKFITLSLFILILSLIWFYRSMIGHYFYQDEFYNLYFRAGDTFSNVISDFNILKPSPNFPFYRPLTTQFFFWLGYSLFGLSPYGYNIINLSFFLMIIILVYLVTQEITKNKNLAVLTAFFYGFSGSNIYRLFNNAQFQEIGLGFFYLLTFYLYILGRKKNNLFLHVISAVTFVFALASKETAITLPFILIIYELLTNFSNKKFKWIIVYILQVIGYLSARYFFFGFAKGGVYTFYLSIKSTINSIIWYFLWSFGLLENMADIRIFNHSIIPSYQLIMNFGSSGAYVAVFFIIFVFWLIISLKLLINKALSNSILEKKTIFFLLFGLIFFFITILPVAFFPFHKFAYSLTLPLYGTALFCAVLALNLFSFSRIFYLFIVLDYLLISLFSYNYAAINHWSFKRSIEAARVINYLTINNPKIDNGSTIHFFDSLRSDQLNLGRNKNNRPPSDFPSWELSQALSNEKGIQLFYKNRNLVIEYEYFNPRFYCAAGKKITYLYPKQFVQ